MPPKKRKLEKADSDKPKKAKKAKESTKKASKKASTKKASTKKASSKKETKKKSEKKEKKAKAEKKEKKVQAKEPETAEPAKAETLSEEDKLDLKAEFFGWKQLSWLPKYKKIKDKRSAKWEFVSDQRHAARERRSEENTLLKALQGDKKARDKALAFIERVLVNDIVSVVDVRNSSCYSTLKALDHPVDEDSEDEGNYQHELGERGLLDWQQD